VEKGIRLIVDYGTADTVAIEGREVRLGADNVVAHSIDDAGVAGADWPGNS
jgi:hypothetical protein